MTHDEAKAKAKRMTALGGLHCTITRILSGSQDPIRPGDNGWDVSVSVTVETPEEN